MTGTKKKVRYQEGDWFLVPLRDGRTALGLVARKSRRGATLGYFFRLPPGELPAAAALLRPDDAVLVRHFGDLNLVNGQWQVLGLAGTWVRDRWPLPKFGRVDEDAGRAWIVEYADGDPNCTLRETPCSVEYARQLPRDVMSGAGAVEIVLTGLLGHGRT
jgi:Immunity protein 26